MPETLAYRAYWFLWHWLDWIYPPRCAGCGRVGEHFCEECKEKVAIIGAHVCTICGVPQPQVQVCLNCQESMPYYKTLRSWAIDKGELRIAIHQLKYQRNVALGISLANPIIAQLHELNWPIDIVVPVPLGLARLAERGYNQASLLARPVALHYQLPYQTHVLRRLRETQSQVGLSFTARKDNVMGAFEANRSQVRGKRVLIVDDVTTSGSTMNACAMALCEADAEEVYGFSLARAGLYDYSGSEDLDEGFN